MKVPNDRKHREFRASFFNYVVKGDDNTFDDHRPSYVEFYSRLSVEQLIDNMTLACDLAAVLSGVVTVKDEDGILVLASKVDSVRRLLKELKEHETKEAKKLYLGVAQHLQWAQGQPDMKRHLCK